MPTQPALPPRYLDVEPVGRGGMGEIFRATDAELGRTVAIKVLAERYARDEQLRERFRREALAAARLSSNPHIVTIYDVADADGQPLIVMEYMPGGSLETRIKGRAPCGVPQVLDWLEQAGAALDAAHDAGVVHRDVKPGNLLLDGRDRLKVADFGVASAAGLDSFTKTGTVLGTAGYLSPEQARGERAGAASDRYSLAVVAWELLVGRRPFEAETPTAEAMAHVNAPIPSICRANRSLPPEYDDVFARALAKAPDARYRSAAEFVGALRRATEDAAGDTGWLEPVTVAAAPAPTHDAAPPPDTPTHRGRRGVWVAALLLLLLAAGGAAAALLATRHHTPSAAPAAPKPVTRTVTTPQVTRTVTTAAAPPPLPATEATTQATAPAPAPAATSPATTAATGGSTGGAQLNAEGYARMQTGDYAGALPLLEQAVQRLQGSGQLDEAYADYNLAYTRYALNRCDGVLDLLDAAQAIEGHKGPIDSLRARAGKTCG